MQRLRKPLEVVCLGIYLTAVFAGTSLEAVAQIFTH